VKTLEELLKPIWNVFGKSADTGAFESPIEEILYDALFKAGLTEMRLQFPVGPYRADLALPSVKVAIEADGAAYHNAKKDAVRDTYFKRQGWAVIRFTGSQIVRNSDDCAEQVIALYEKRLANFIY
jgi:very-short-patch-repair endonuclease